MEEVNGKLIARFVRMFKCDTARVEFIGKKYFLILGWNERSEGEWFDQDGKSQNFDYVREQTVASGDTVDELVSSAKKYKKICGMSWSDYFAKELKAGKEVVKMLKERGM